MFCRCVTGATCDTSRSTSACTQIGMLHECCSRVDDGNSSPVRRSYAYRRGRTPCWPPAWLTQKRPYPSSEIAPVQNQQSSGSGPATTKDQNRSRSDRVTDQILHPPSTSSTPTTPTAQPHQTVPNASGLRPCDPTRPPHEAAARTDKRRPRGGRRNHTGTRTYRTTLHTDQPRRHSATVPCVISAMRWGSSAQPRGGARG
jgi:hypothetical protein